MSLKLILGPAWTYVQGHPPGQVLQPVFSPLGQRGGCFGGCGQNQDVGRGVHLGAREDASDRERAKYGKRSEDARMRGGEWRCRF